MSTMTGIKELAEDFINLFYPRTCVTCSEGLLKQEYMLCSKCLYELPKTNFHKTPDNSLEQVFWGRVKIKSATSLFYFNKGSRYQHALHALKYNGYKEIGITLGMELGIQLAGSEYFRDIDLIIPVPLHPRKERKRGYNQSFWIAKGIEKILHCPVQSKILRRTKFTETQTKKSRTERWENVKSVFKVADEKLIENKYVLLIDDVVTTGATLEACAATILSVPGATVSVATLAVA